MLVSSAPRRTEGSSSFHEAQLLPPSAQDHVPADRLSRLIVLLVREELDLSGIVGSYRSGLVGRRLILG
jgi:hypothetical protein